MQETDNNNVTQGMADLLQNEHVHADLKVEEVEKEYVEFTRDWVGSVDNINNIVKIEEIQNIQSLIEDFQERLNGVAAKEQSNAEKVADKTISRLSAIPFLGKFIEGEAQEVKERERETKTARDLLQEMFDMFKEKNVFLTDAYEGADKLLKVLNEKREILAKFSAQVKYLVLTTDGFPRMKAIPLGGSVESAVIKNEGKITNLTIMLQLIEKQLITIATQMPAIESSLIEDTDIGMFLTTMSDMNEVFSSLSTLSNAVGAKSSTKVMGMIVEVNDSMEDNLNFDHLGTLVTAQEKFLGAMATSNKAKAENDQQKYAKLLSIGQDMNNQAIAYKKETEKLMISGDSKDMRKVEQAIEDTIEIIDDVEIIDDLKVSE